MNPLHTENNVNGLPACPASEHLSRRHPELFERQCAHVRRIVTETRRYHNVIYEICNEPGGRATAAEGPTVDEANDRLDALIAEVRQVDHAGAGRHLIAGQEAFLDKPFLQTLDRSYDAMGYDVVNVHPLPATRLRGADYHLGTFMSKQLRLQAFRDMTLAAHAEPKPLNHDEDNVASQYRDPDGWTVHRKRVWVALLCGAHYDVIDFSIQPLLEEGTPDAQTHLRPWFRHLSAYMHHLDLARSPSGRHYYWDQRIDRHPDTGRLVATFWTYDTQRGGPVDVHISRGSADEHTWSMPAPTGLPGQHTQPLAMAGDRLLALFPCRTALPGELAGIVASKAPTSERPGRLIGAFGSTRAARGWKRAPVAGHTLRQT